MNGCDDAFPDFCRPVMPPVRSPSRRRFLRAVTISAGVLLAGCGHKNANGKTTLTQWYHEYGETGTHDAVLRYAQQYTQLNPHIDIQVIWVPGDYGTKLETALLTGGPDIFEESQLTQAMVEAGQVAALDDLFTPQVRADFAPTALAENTVNGHIYGIKTVQDTGLLYYRKSLLAQANLAPLTTLDAVMAAAKALTTATRKGLFLGNDGGISALLTILPQSAGQEIIVGNKIAFDTPRTALSYQKLAEINKSGVLLMGAPTDFWEPSSFTQGLAAMQWSGLWAYPAIHQALGDDVGAVPWPAMDAQGRPATFAGGWSEYVNGQSDNIEEAKRYLQWLWISNTADQRDWNLSYGFHVPPRLSVARTAAALRAPVPAAGVQALNQYGQYLPPSWTASMGADLTNAVTNIVKFNDSAADQVHNAARLCERELSRLLE
jgi:multiple sugar transport system substrate-binding protein